MCIGPFTVWGLRLRQTPPIPSQLWKTNFEILNFIFSVALKGCRCFCVRVPWVAATGNLNVQLAASELAATTYLSPAVSVCCQLFNQLALVG